MADQPEPGAGEEPKILTGAALEEREHIVNTAVRLGCPRDIIVKLLEIGSVAVRVDSFWNPLKFYLLTRPGMEPYEKWEERNVAALRKLCRENRGSYDPPRSVRRRGPGETGRNATPEERYEWVAWRLFRWSYKDIVFKYRGRLLTPDQFETEARAIRQAVARIFKAAMIEDPWRELARFEHPDE